MKPIACRETQFTGSGAGANCVNRLRKIHNRGSAIKREQKEVLDGP